MPHHIHVAASGSHAGALLLLPRFSWQCGRFHELSKFQDGNKSCRDALARHNARRQRRKEGLRASRVGTAHAAGALYRVHSSAELNSPMARPMQPRYQQHAAGAAGSAAGVRRVLSCPGLAEAAMPQLQGGGAGQATASSAQPLSMPSPAQLQGCGAEAAAAMATPFAPMAALPFEAGAAPVASGMGMNAVAYRGCTHSRASSLPALLQPPQPLHAGGWGYQADAADTFNPAPLHAPAEGLYAGPSPCLSPGLARQGELQQAMLQPQSLLAGSSLGTVTAPAAGPWQPAAWERLGTPASSMPASPLAPASPASGNGAAGVEGRPPHAAGSARSRKLAKFEVCGSPGHRATFPQCSRFMHACTCSCAVWSSVGTIAGCLRKPPGAASTPPRCGSPAKSAAPRCICPADGPGAGELQAVPGTVNAAGAPRAPGRHKVDAGGSGEWKYFV